MATPGTEQWARLHYGPPCVGPHRTIKFFGRNVTVHAKAARGFRRIERVFKNKAPEYHRHLLKQTDIWTYNCRKIGSTTTYSNHAWPIAADLDSAENSQGRPYKDCPIWKRARKAVLQLEKEGVVRWGGRYSNPDPMHFEIVLTPEQLKARYYWNGRRKPRR